MKHRLSDRVFNGLNLAFLGLASAAALFPIYYTFVLSFTDPAEYYRKPLIFFRPSGRPRLTGT